MQNCLIESARTVEDPAERRLNRRRQRIELLGSLDVGDRLREAPQSHEQHAFKEMGVQTVRVEFQGAAELHLGTRPIPVV
jgi:hypothetical protein